MKKIKLTQNQYALVDNRDFEKVSKYKWYAYYDKTTKSYYVRTNIYGGLYKQKTLLLHRFVLNAPKGKKVDHINRNPLDNRKSNLRFCSNSESSRNTGKRKGVSKFKGVCFYKPNNKWRARIRVNKKTKYLGYFKSDRDAAKAYDFAASKHFKKFAYLNFESK